MKVVITGACGGVGRFVVERLAGKHELVLVDNCCPDDSLAKLGDFRQVDLLNAQKTIDSIDDDTDVVIHLAAIPRPSEENPCDKVIHVNMVTTYNILEAVREKNIRRIIYAGSDSGMGFGIRRITYKPEYLPMDAKHSCWPHEGYSFSKHFSEEMCKEYSRAYGIETISLRFMWVWLNMSRDVITSILNDEAKWMYDGLGAYVMPQDVAQIIDLSINYQMCSENAIPFEVFFAHAAETFLPIDTLKHAQNLWPEMPQITNPRYYKDNPRAPFYDMTDTYKKLGYKPQYSYKNF